LREALYKFILGIYNEKNCDFKKLEFDDTNNIKQKEFNLSDVNIISDLISTMDHLLDKVGVIYVITL